MIHSSNPLFLEHHELWLAYSIQYSEKYIDNSITYLFNFPKLKDISRKYFKILFSYFKSILNVSRS